MKALWLDKREKYDGAQLKPLRNYLEHKQLGDSVVAWRGACDVSFANMKDGEDLLAQAAIAGSDMVHFVFELFDVSLFAGVAFQRLFADLARQAVTELAAKPSAPSVTALMLTREGDDLYFMPERRKLSISIAIPSLNSVLIHFAVNVSNKGTPVPTAALKEWGVDPRKFAERAMALAREEHSSIREATWKVRP